jgi:hypothetical protein
LNSGGLAFDSSPLNYIARANHLPLLGKLVAGNDCVITRAVEDELLRGLTACIDDRAARRHGQERGVPLTRDTGVGVPGHTREYR